MGNASMTFRGWGSFLLSTLTMMLTGGSPLRVIYQWMLTWPVLSIDLFHNDNYQAWELLGGAENTCFRVTAVLSESLTLS